MPASPPDAAAVRAQLERILVSPGFANAGRLSRFLRFVVERTLDGEGDQLKEYRLGTEVFDRPSDYDPRLDSIVRVEARRLRSKLAEYYEGPGRADPVAIRVDKGSYTAAFETAIPGSIVGATTRSHRRGRPATARAAVFPRRARRWLPSRWRSPASSSLCSPAADRRRNTARPPRDKGALLLRHPLRHRARSSRASPTRYRRPDRRAGPPRRRGDVATSVMPFRDRRPLSTIAATLWCRRCRGRIQVTGHGSGLSAAGRRPRDARCGWTPSPAKRPIDGLGAPRRPRAGAVRSPASGPGIMSVGLPLGAHLAKKAKAESGGDRSATSGGLARCSLRESSVAPAGPALRRVQSVRRRRDAPPPALRDGAVAEPRDEKDKEGH